MMINDARFWMMYEISNFNGIDIWCCLNQETDDSNDRKSFMYLSDDIDIEMMSDCFIEIMRLMVAIQH